MNMWLCDVSEEQYSRCYYVLFLVSERLAEGCCFSISSLGLQPDQLCGLADEREMTTNNNTRSKTKVSCEASEKMHGSKPLEDRVERYPSLLDRLERETKKMQELEKRG